MFFIYYLDYNFFSSKVVRFFHFIFLLSLFFIFLFFIFRFSFLIYFFFLSYCVGVCVFISDAASGVGREVALMLADSGVHVLAGKRK